jgi:hypothetical protein
MEFYLELDQGLVIDQCGREEWEWFNLGSGVLEPAIYKAMTKKKIKYTKVVVLSAECW